MMEQDVETAQGSSTVEGRSRRSVIGAALVAASAVAIASGVALAAPWQHHSRVSSGQTRGVSQSQSPSAESGSTSGPPSPGATASASTRSTTATASRQPLLAAGKEAPGRQVPWDQVGAGWALALWNPQTAPNGARLHPTVDSTLFLLNPAGGRYRLASVPADATLTDWSDDHQHAAFTRAPSTNGGTPRTAAMVLDLRTGRPTNVPAPPTETTFASFSSADGSTFVAYEAPAGGVGDAALKRFSTEGALLSTYSADVRYALTGPDGSSFIGKKGTRLALISNDGTVQKYLAVPVGYQTCDAYGWWSDAEVAASCTRSGTAAGIVNVNVFAIGVDGSAPKAITNAPAGSDTAHMGFTSAYRTRLGVVAVETSSCGAGRIDVLNSAGTAGTQLTLPIADTGGTRYSLVAASNDHLLVDRNGCGQPGGLFSDDLRSHTAAAVLGEGANGGTVLQSLS